MTLLVVSPDFASHYGPLSVVATAVRRAGHRVVVATGESMRPRVETDGLEWRLLRLGAASNSGVADRDPALERFLDATRRGPVAAIEYQAGQRRRDLLWQPERVVEEIAAIVRDVAPDEVLVDQVSFASTLALHALGRPFVSLVPGHPSQLPTGGACYGIPTDWPRALRPDDAELDRLSGLGRSVAASFTDRWNEALAAVCPDRPAVADAFGVHGHRVLYNTIPGLLPTRAAGQLPPDHRFVGPLVRPEDLPERFGGWATPFPGGLRVFVAFGTFLSHREDVLAKVVEALRRVGARAAVAVGDTPPKRFGPVPDDWLIAPSLPQVALLRGSDVAVHHGGNNSVQESLAAGVGQLVLPFSTDQFSNAADLERIGSALVRSPNDASVDQLAEAIEGAGSTRADPVPPLSDRRLVEAVFG